MLYFVIKVLITATVIVAISEIAKRSTVWAALLASLPLTSLLAFMWIYLESGDAQRVAQLSHSIFWLVLPSLPLFLLLPFLLRASVPFWASLALACATTALLYAAMLWVLPRVGIDA